MFSGIFAIVSPHSCISIISRFNYIRYLMVKSFLCAENIKIMKAYQTIYHIFTVFP
ncbi:hypothetical protein DSECCO2_437140 [anaerobic digester metagenome]